MTAEKEYNGYHNYETWNVSLWIDNDQGMQSYLIQLAEEATDINELSNTIKDWILEEQPDLGCSMWSDLLSAAISEVDWYEIAELAFNEYHIVDSSDDTDE